MIVIDGEFVTIRKGAIIETEKGTGVTKESMTVFIGTGSGTHPVTLEHWDDPFARLRALTKGEDVSNDVD